ncbi:hypothetical protein GCM10010156_53020 [Planobispora rosea]|uniref:Uncharacterized protein n=1 Tax=Planobispora rosea TaxID=35762 RepID=A0A8J3S9I9_PLARO|nr:hypothetical protein [Planobispora rosea]GGS87954.1 hypothetical protein GCM10010156_53020 [Planobispora rosea]GIH88572.1 hypothetical protein Pro02_69800 [Planobispora rosea]
MNSLMEAAVALQRHQREQRDILALTRLHAALLARGLRAEWRDNNSALLVRGPNPGLPVLVTISYGGSHYCWHDDDHRHPTGDPEGAVRALADFLGR